MWAEAGARRGEYPMLDDGWQAVEELCVLVIGGGNTPMCAQHGLEEDFEGYQLQQICAVRFDDQHLLKRARICEIALRMSAHSDEVCL